MHRATTFGAAAATNTRLTAALAERRFFGGMAVVLLLTVLAGFSRTYYFNDFVAEPFALTPLLHWHGAAFTAWMLLLITETTLIAAHRHSVHKQLGVLGAMLAALMVPLGMMVAVTRTASGELADNGAPPLVFLAVPLVGMLVFAGLVGAALHWRRNSAVHKRLMLLATLELATAGVARLP